MRTLRLVAHLCDLLDRPDSHVLPGLRPPRRERARADRDVSGRHALAGGGRQAQHARRATPAVRLAGREHTSRPWRIHEVAHDFRLEDVWALPTPGGPDDFPRLVRQMALLDPSRSSSRVGSALFAIRWKLGELLGWDEADAGLGSRVPTLRDRLPADLGDVPAGPDVEALPFTPLYMLDDEFAAEIANRTMHGVMHLGWVPDGQGGYRGQMAVLVKPNGFLGEAYMAAVKPFRHLFVYPPLVREIGRAWRTGDAAHTLDFDERVAAEGGLGAPAGKKRPAPRASAAPLGPPLRAEE